MLNLKLLNKQQYKAVTKLTGKTYVVSGAGCGKTRVLTYRIAYLIENGFNEENIFAFTFTNKAANEMKNRLKELLGREVKVTLSTFHSYCNSILYSFPEYIGYEPHYHIIDEDDKKSIVNNIINTFKIDLKDNIAIKAISNYKNLIPYKSKSLKENMDILKVYYTYQKTLLNSNKMDFDDLLYQFLKLLKNQTWLKEIFQNNCVQILVDECQDINKIQYEIILELAKINQNIFLVGDEDQCIYSFRGSDISCINDFITNQQAEVIKLEQNYRSSKNILDAANSVIKQNQNRIDKHLFTNYEENNFKLVVANLNTDYEEAIYITSLIKALLNRGYKYSDFAILYRNNSVSINIEKELLKQELPYVLIGKIPFFKHKEIKLLISYLLFLINNKDDISFSYIYNTPPRGIGETTFNKIKDIAKEKEISLFEALTILKNQTKNENLENFYNFIYTESLNLTKQTPIEFLNNLIRKLDYLTILRKEVNSKEKVNRVFTLLEMFEQIELNDSSSNLISNFLNNLYLENITQKEQGLIKLMTIHQAKGLEYKIVIVAGCNEGILPTFKLDYPSLEEERRIFYVAITRAKERLYLLSARKRLINGKYQEHKISPFILEIQKELINYN